MFWRDAPIGILMGMSSSVFLLFWLLNLAWIDLSVNPERVEEAYIQFPEYFTWLKGLNLGLRVYNSEQ